MQSGEPDETRHAMNSMRQPPWWERYVFTACVLGGFAVFLIVCGYIGRIPFAEHALLVLMTIAGVVEAIRTPLKARSVLGHVLLMGFLALASCAYISQGAHLLGAGYSFLAIVWLCLAISVVRMRHRLGKEGSLKLERAVESLRRATQDDGAV